MSGKALVIKGVNFVANKLAVVTLEEPIRCTSLSINKTSIAFTAIGATSTITATIAPLNTTDDVVWSSSNPNVATVANGVVTCVGIGTATITVACGTKYATCSVASTVTINLAATGYGRDNHCHTAKNAARDYISLTESDYAMTFYDSTNELNGYKAASASFSPATEWETRYPIPMPLGASQVKLRFPSAILGGARIGFVNANQMTTYGSGLTSAKALEHMTNTTLVTESVGKSCTFDISNLPAGVNGIIVSFTLGTSSYTAESITGDFTAEFT
jgi:hypothetical protein